MANYYWCAAIAVVPPLISTWLKIITEILLNSHEDKYTKKYNTTFEFWHFRFFNGHVHEEYKTKTKKKNSKLTLIVTSAKTNLTDKNKIAVVQICQALL